eukprot:567431_1
MRATTLFVVLFSIIAINVELCLSINSQQQCAPQRYVPLVRNNSHHNVNLDAVDASVASASSRSLLSDSALVSAPGSKSSSVLSPGSKSASVSSPGSKSASGSTSSEETPSPARCASPLSLPPLAPPSVTPSPTITSPPTAQPIDAGRCNNITHFVWNALLDESGLKPNISYNVSIDASLSLAIDVDLEYLGYAYANADDTSAAYGVTYVLDFESFNAESDDIRLPGNCQNRIRSSLITPSFSALWLYSQTPTAVGDLGHAPYLAYPPPSQYWNLSMADDQCTLIHYHGEFTWIELLQCTDYHQTTHYIHLVEDANWVNVTGVFYVNIVSPLAPTLDRGYYRVYQSLSVPFIIAIQKQVNIISSAGIDLFEIAIIGVYPVAVHKSDADNDWSFAILTESADFLMLHSPTIISFPNIGFTFTVHNDSTNTDCLSSGFVCLQLWEISIDNVPCPPTDFSGNYTLHFQIGCNPSATYTNALEICTEHTAEYATGVTLSVPLEWTDEVCDAYVYTIEFEAGINYFVDSSFTALGDRYGVGDIAYVQVMFGDHGDDYDMADLILDNVWICTTSPENEPLEIGDANLGTSGCLSADLDPVHVQLTLDLTPSAGRRRILLQSEEDHVSQKRHYSGAIEITDIDLQENDIDDGFIDAVRGQQPLIQSVYGTITISVIGTSVVCVCCFVSAGLINQRRQDRQWTFKMH